MAKMHLETCPTSLSIREMQFKMTLKFYLKSVRMPKVNDTRTVGAGKEVKQVAHSSIAGWEVKLLFMGIYQKDTSYYHVDTCSIIFIAALFRIVRNWK